MTPDKIIRIALWVSVPFNALAAFMAANPASWPAQQLGMPLEVPAPYPEMLAFFIALFGAAYAWLALQKIISRPLLGFAAFGKLGVFLIVALLWVSGAVGGLLVLMGCGDLALAGIFFWWLIRTARYANK